MSKSCNYGGGWCPDLAIEGGAGRCAKHAPKHAAVRESLQVHYSTQHRRLRVLAFSRDTWTCVKCGWRPPCVREWSLFPEQLHFPPAARILAELTREYKTGRRHLQADHIIDVETRPDLAADLDNYQTLCSECHATKTGKARRF